MHDRPTVHELLEVVQGFLDAEIVPATSGRTQFLARVAANCVRMVDRELQGEVDQARRAWEGLDALLGEESFPGDRTDRAQAITRRLESLCERIRAGEFEEGSVDHGRVLAFVRERVRDKLTVSNPKLLAADDDRGNV